MVSPTFTSLSHLRLLHSTVMSELSFCTCFCLLLTIACVINLQLSLMRILCSHCHRNNSTRHCNPEERKGAGMGSLSLLRPEHRSDDGLLQRSRKHGTSGFFTAYHVISTTDTAFIPVSRGHVLLRDYIYHGR